MYKIFLIAVLSWPNNNVTIQSGSTVETYPDRETCETAAKERMESIYKHVFVESLPKSVRTNVSYGCKTKEQSEVANEVVDKFKSYFKTEEIDKAR